MNSTAQSLYRKDSTCLAEYGDLSINHLPYRSVFRLNSFAILPTLFADISVTFDNGIYFIFVRPIFNEKTNVMYSDVFFTISNV